MNSTDIKFTNHTISGVRIEWRLSAAPGRSRRLSQKVLGAKAGLRQETISLIENGNPAATIETLLSILAALDLEFLIATRSKQSEL